MTPIKREEIITLESAKMTKPVPKNEESAEEEIKVANDVVKSADSGATKRAVIIASGVILILLSILFHTGAMVWLAENPWFHSALVDGPALALVIIALLELRHSGEANEERKKANAFRDEANALRNEANELRREMNRLTEALDAERNKNLQLIAQNTKPQPTKAQKHAAILRKYIGKTASITEGDVAWVATPEIVEVNEDDILTLFTPKGTNSSYALGTWVHCGDLEVVEMPHGDCPVRINVLKRYGPDVKLGEIARWEDRNQPAAAVPVIEKGQIAWHAFYGKGGSAEVRSLHIFQAADGSNRFILEAKPGGIYTGDNVDISKQFMARQVEFFAERFERRSSGSGEIRGGHFLYVNC